MKIKQGDNVKVIAGKDRGKTGKIKQVFRHDQRVVVEGVNIVKRHRKNTGQQDQPAGIIEFEAPIHISNVMVLDNKDKPTRVGFKIEKNKKIRIAKTTGSKLD